MAIEKDIFVPFISANLGKSLDEVTKQEVKLKEFKPKFEVQYLSLMLWWRLLRASNKFQTKMLIWDW